MYMRKAVNNGRVRGEGRVRDISNVPTQRVCDRCPLFGPVFLASDA